ncbi:MAG: helix-turn-helix transcriptional regulator [Bacteriovoracaceae bacterium]
MSTLIQKNLLHDLDKVLKKYSIKEYNSQAIVEILSRSLKRKTGSHSELILNKDAISPAKVLRLQRQQLGLSLAKLAQITGISKSNLSAMENSKRLIGLKIAKVLAKALGINYKALI